MEIELCKSCKGIGTNKDYVESDFDEYKIIKCPKCNGTGRELVSYYQIRLPFNVDTSKYYGADEKIHKIIRELKLNN